MYAAFVVLILLTVALLVIWFAAEEHGRVVQEVEQSEPEPLLFRPVRFAPGEAASVPLTARSLDAVHGEPPLLSCDCTAEGEQAQVSSRVRRIRFGGEVLYARVCRCPVCEARTTSYYRVLASDVALPGDSIPVRA